MQRPNNLLQGDSKNIHFTATYESVYLRQQRQTLEWGWGKVKKNHNSIRQETKEENMKMKQDGVCISMVPAWDFSVTLGGNVWVLFYLSRLTRLSGWNETSFILTPLFLLPFLRFCYIYLSFLFLFYLFIYLGVLMSNQLSTPIFINMSDATVLFYHLPLCG